MGSGKAYVRACPDHVRAMFGPKLGELRYLCLSQGAPGVLSELIQICKVYYGHGSCWLTTGGSSSSGALTHPADSLHQCTYITNEKMLTYKSDVFAMQKHLTRGVDIENCAEIPEKLKTRKHSKSTHKQSKIEHVRETLCSRTYVRRT